MNIFPEGSRELQRFRYLLRVLPEYPENRGVRVIKKYMQRMGLNYELNYILDKDNHVISCDYRTRLIWMYVVSVKRFIVRKDYLNDIHISTMFLSIDQRYILGHADRPILFETLMYNSKKQESKQHYHTWAEAVQGHRHWLRFVRL